MFASFKFFTTLFVTSVFEIHADQAASENSIPLSPQWLYAKPNDAKPVCFWPLISFVSFLFQKRHSSASMLYHEPSCFIVDEDICLS